MASARSRTTDCGCCCTVECHGKLHLPHECGAAPPAWPRRDSLTVVNPFFAAVGEGALKRAAVLVGASAGSYRVSRARWVAAE